MTTQETVIETVDLRVQESVATARLGEATLQRGYVYRCQKNGEAPEIETEDGEDVAFGFHGTDAPPCGAEYLCDDNDGYLVISTEHEADAIEVVDGWTLEPADDLERGQVFCDGTYTLVIVKQHGRDHEYTACGTL